MKIIVRQEGKEDRAEVLEINKHAFGRENEARLVELLRVSNAFVPELSLVAACDNKLAGYVLFTKITIKDRSTETESLALAPLAVLPEFQKKGIGGSLIKSGLKRAGELSYKSVIVLGHDKYYPKFGFVPAKKWNITAPFKVNVNSFMAIELFPQALTGVSGVVNYAKEFELV